MSSYKYCIVPKCKNTTVSTPKKLFFRVPMDKKVRNKWFAAMRRDSLSEKSVKFCCEDHFDVETDMENYQRYKLMGGIHKLKKEVLPHKFACQNKEAVLAERSAFKKRQQATLLEKVVCPDVCHENLLPHAPEFNACESPGPSSSHDIDPLVDVQNTIDSPKSKTVAAQVKNKYRRKATNTENCDYNIPKSETVNKRQYLKPRKPSISSNTSVSTIGVNSFVTRDSDSDSDQMKEKIENELFNKKMGDLTIKAILKHPKLFIGVPPQLNSCIEFLSSYIDMTLMDVLLTLRKIRWQEPDSLLAVHFGVTESTVQRRFRETLPKIAQCMQELVFMPKRDDIRMNLPIPFRKRYSKVVSIIDCFEVQIDKPSAAVTQALTWSSYKNCNTVKYMISFTPDGLINFISKGYGGRTSDAVIFEDCGFLNILTPGDVVIADRGFKNIAQLLERQYCTLLRPPSVVSGTKLSKDQVLETNTIAAHRVHVEKSIGRLREFGMISSHACVDITYVNILDFIVITSCGMVNLQENFFPVIT